MAFIHTAGGHVIRVTAGRETIAMAIKQGLAGNQLIELETESQRPIKVSLNAQQVAVITEEPLPRAI
jgi:hypothetical protein